MKDHKQYQEKSMYSAEVESQIAQLDRMHEGNRPEDQDMGKFYHSNNGNSQPGPAGGKK